MFKIVGKGVAESWILRRFGLLRLWLLSHQRATCLFELRSSQLTLSNLLICDLAHDRSKEAIASLICIQHLLQSTPFVLTLFVN